MLNYILEKAAKWLGKIDSEEVDTIAYKIKAINDTNGTGQAKAEMVIDWALDHVFQRDVPKWIAQTVVQIIFALLRRKGLV